MLTLRLVCRGGIGMACDFLSFFELLYDIIAGVKWGFEPRTPYLCSAYKAGILLLELIAKGVKLTDQATSTLKTTKYIIFFTEPPTPIPPSLRYYLERYVDLSVSYSARYFVLSLSLFLFLSTRLHMR